MDTSSSKGSVRYYPWDMFVLLYSSFPLLGLMMWIGSLSFLNGWERTTALSAAFLFALTGVGLLAWAKWPLYKAGIYFSFGTSAIPVSHRVYYRWGMGMVVIGCLLLMGLAF